MLHLRPKQSPNLPSLLLRRDDDCQGNDSLRKGEVLEDQVYFVVPTLLPSSRKVESKRHRTSSSLDEVHDPVRSISDEFDVLQSMPGLTGVEVHGSLVFVVELGDEVDGIDDLVELGHGIELAVGRVRGLRLEDGECFEGKREV